jgi:tropomyosin-1
MSQRADSGVKKSKKLEIKNTLNEEQCHKLEKQLKEEQFLMAESEFKYDDIARKLATMVFELERSNERFTCLHLSSGNMESISCFFLSYRCTLGELKIVDLEEELRVIGQNLQQLEVSEEKALQREENYQNQIKHLSGCLKTAENREENAIMNIQRLNIRIDHLEEDWLHEKLNITGVSDDLDQTFVEMIFS